MIMMPSPDTACRRVLHSMEVIYGNLKVIIYNVNVVIKSSETIPLKVD